MADWILHKVSYWILHWFWTESLEKSLRCYTEVEIWLGEEELWISSATVFAKLLLFLRKAPCWNKKLSFRLSEKTTYLLLWWIRNNSHLESFEPSTKKKRVSKPSEYDQRKTENKTLNNPDSKHSLLWAIVYFWFCSASGRHIPN